VSPVGLRGERFGELVKLVLGHAAPSLCRMWRLMRSSDGLQHSSRSVRIPPFGGGRLGDSGSAMGGRFQVGLLHVHPGGSGSEDDHHLCDKQPHMGAQRGSGSRHSGYSIESGIDSTIAPLYCDDPTQAMCH
jgi:hypothetical protein